jgi:5'(3')-deoxyribonucleotidase
MSDITNIKSIRFIGPNECPHIIIDMDEVVADTLPPIMEKLNAIDGTNVPDEAITNYDFTNFFNVTHDGIHKLFLEHNILENLEPLPGAIDALQRIRKLGYKIHIVTARAWHPQAVAITMEWLDRYGGIYDSVSVSMGRAQTKSDVYKYVSDRFAYIVDDGLHNITDAIDSEIVDEVVVIAAPWNASTDTFSDKTVNSLAEFATFLERGVELNGD